MNSPIMQIDVVIPSQTRYLKLIGSIGEHVARELDSYGGDKEAFAYHLNLVLTEAIANVIKHADIAKPEETVRILIQLEENRLTIKIYDHGQGFDLENIPLPDFEQPKENGMGLFFIRTLMDSVTYSKQAEGNVLEIIKNL